jgi:hypothetical protein
MGMVIGIVGLAALAVPLLVATIALIFYIFASHKLERGSWTVWISLVGFSGIVTVLIAIYTNSHTMSQLSPQHGMAQREGFNAMLLFAVWLGSTPGISAIFGLLALAIPRKRELIKPANLNNNKAE